MTGIVVMIDGARPFALLVRAPAWWFAAPGVLGTLCVLVSLQGYSRFGASVTIAVLVASQLTAGLLFDAWRSGGIGWQAGIGVLLLAAGAGLVANASA